MGVRVTTDFESNFRAFVGRIEKDIHEELIGAVEAVVRAGALNAKEFTATRGRPTSKFGGRVDTAAMIEALSSRVEVEASRIVGEFGFVGEKADYYILQTVTGFRHWISDQFIEPTFAIRDAGNIASDDMLAAMRAALRRVK